MGIIKDIDELNQRQKIFIISIPIIMTFWYISLYLFHKHFFQHNDLIIKLSFCFTLSICWYLVNILPVWLTIPKIIKTPEPEAELFVTAFTSIIYLSVVILFSYFFKLKFICFLSIAFFWTFIRIIYLSLIYLCKKSPIK